MCSDPVSRVCIIEKERNQQEKQSNRLDHGPPKGACEEEDQMRMGHRVLSCSAAKDVAEMLLEVWNAQNLKRSLECTVKGLILPVVG